MASRIQGEGDKQAARRFNANETRFVKRGGANGKPAATQPGDEAAAAAGKSRAKHGEQDAIDAKRLRDKVGKNK